jgi:hypothetical protein
VNGFACVCIPHSHCIVKTARHNPASIGRESTNIHLLLSLNFCVNVIENEQVHKNCRGYKSLQNNPKNKWSKQTQTNATMTLLVNRMFLFLTHQTSVTLHCVNEFACDCIPHSHCLVTTARHNPATIGRESTTKHLLTSDCLH